jgi:hypothetical protein
MMFRCRARHAVAICGLARSTPVLLAPKTYFELLHVPFSATVTPAALQKNYHDLQAKVHPDLQTQNGPMASSSSQQPTSGTSASVNASKAYKILKSDYNRCRYISQLVRHARAGQPLEKSGPVVGDCVEMGAEDSNVKMPKEFLMDLMELNETIFTADRESDEGKKAWEAAKEEVLARCDEQWQQCQRLWQAAGGDMTAVVAAAQEGRDVKAVPGPSKEELAFHDALHRWTYFNNLRGHIHELDE